MRSLRHRFDTANQSSAGFAKLNHLRAGNDRLNAAPTETINRERGPINWNACFQSYVPCSIDRVT